MTDERLEQLVDEGMRAYRVPQDPPLEAMWARVEREAFEATAGLQHPTSVPRPWRGRWAAVAGIAATLTVGFGLGRFTAPAAPGEPMVASSELPVATVVVSAPLQRTTSDFLGDTEVLLASLPRDVTGLDPSFVTDARRLLATTRLLIDSPLGADQRLRDMLEDLELVLVQVARLRPTPRAEELTFIAAAMDERDVMPRLRTVAAALSNSDY